jgi:RNA polymerase sigma-70 factor (ECF subfamily)
VAREDAALARSGEGELLDLRRAILRLPDDYREPLVMQVLGGYSTAEIAKEMNLSIPAVLTRLFRARNRLREIYGLTPGLDCEPGTDKGLEGTP